MYKHILMIFWGYLIRKEELCTLTRLARTMKRLDCTCGAHTCSSQSDSRYDESLIKQLSKPQSSLSLRHSQPALLTKGMRSIWRQEQNSQHFTNDINIYTLHVVYITLCVCHISLTVTYFHKPRRFTPFIISVMSNPGVGHSHIPLECQSPHCFLGHFQCAV